MAEELNLGYGTGRRKEAVARVFLRAGSGKITVNGKGVDEYFPSDTLRRAVQRPLEVLDVKNRFDVYATSSGGGVAGQAGAVRLGVARALVDYDEKINPPVTRDEEEEDGGSDSGAVETSYRRLLRAAGENLLSRDARKVERKKPGLRKARKRPQYSKR